MGRLDRVLSVVVTHKECNNGLDAEMSIARDVELERDWNIKQPQDTREMTSWPPAGSRGWPR